MFRNASILVVGDNFGCGSSREHAPWALLNHGFRCVIGPGFGDIFFSNSVNCGLLLMQVSRPDVKALAAAVSPGGVRLTIDLVSQRIFGETDWNFDIPPAA